MRFFCEDVSCQMWKVTLYTLQLRFNTFQGENTHTKKVLRLYFILKIDVSHPQFLLVVGGGHGKKLI